MFWKRFTVLLAALAFVCGCNPPRTEHAASKSAGTDTNRESYQVKGVVKELKADGKTAVIAHEKIPNYMEAMTMDFEVKDKTELSGLKAGDRIAFTLVVTTNDAWIENTRKLAPENVNASATNAAPPNMRKSPIVEPLETGDMLPDYKLTNQLAQPISFAQFRGKALGITFLFTRCPLPTYCPRMSSNFSTAANKLKTAGGTTNWMLLSISFDPEWDTPERLAAYSKQYNPDTNHWQFATSDFWNIDGLTEQLGLQFWKAEGGSINHNLRTAVFDTRGRLQKLFVGNEWKPEELVEEMIKAAQVK